MFGYPFQHAARHLFSHPRAEHYKPTIYKASFGLGFGGEVLHGGGLMQSEIPSGLDQDVLWGKADINEIP